ncbi:MAG: hypothetical protein HC774_08330 [Sphingomonadales bacterium]|nr:hypothetical protein [Sphingomonadales bacterium]
MVISGTRNRPWPLYVALATSAILSLFFALQIPAVADGEAATLAWLEGKATGLDTVFFPGAQWLFVPMKSARGAAGVIGLLPAVRVRLGRVSGLLAAAIARDGQHAK